MDGTHKRYANLVRSATLTPDTDAPGASIPGLPPRFLARITLHAPGSDETANLQLVAQIENRLLGLQAISRVEVTLLPAPFPKQNSTVNWRKQPNARFEAARLETHIRAYEN